MTIKELIKELEAIPDALKDTVILRAQYNRNRDCRYDEATGISFLVSNVRENCIGNRLRRIVITRW